MRGRPIFSRDASRQERVGNERVTGKLVQWRGPHIPSRAGARCAPRVCARRHSRLEQAGSTRRSSSSSSACRRDGQRLVRLRLITYPAFDFPAAERRGVLRDPQTPPLEVRRRHGVGAHARRSHIRCGLKSTPPAALERAPRVERTLRHVGPLLRLVVNI